MLLQQFFPLAPPLVLLFVLLILFVIAAMEIGAIQYAYEKIGINRPYVFALLLLSLWGSYINIPIAELPARFSNQDMPFFGLHHVLPWVQQWTGTEIAINFGGAVIPTLLSIYLVRKHRIVWAIALAVVVVTTAVYWLARPVQGVGIAVPTVVPALAATGLAFLLTEQARPAVAYVAGTLGTLIGADLLNFSRFQGLGTSMVSIGGAGTFDAIFLTGIIAVLLA